MLPSQEQQSTLDDCLHLRITFYFSPEFSQQLQLKACLPMVNTQTNFRKGELDSYGKKNSNQPWKRKKRTATKDAACPVVSYIYHFLGRSLDLQGKNYICFESSNGIVQKQNMRKRERKFFKSLVRVEINSDYSTHKMCNWYP